jgi:hypothetical protein
MYNVVPGPAAVRITRRVRLLGGEGVELNAGILGGVKLDL